MIATGREIGQAWNETDVRGEGSLLSPFTYGLYPRPDWFDELGRGHIGQISYDAMKRLKDEHHAQHGFDKGWYPKKWHLVAQGVAIGIKLGLKIAELRQGDNQDDAE